MKNSWLGEVKFDAKGLVPAIVQDVKSGEVLMMAYMNRQALEKTLKTGKTHFYSRSRRRLWLKGESSGHFQRVRRVALDCDADALLIHVQQTGGACHEGYKGCFFRALGKDKCWRTTGKKLFDPAKVYGSASLRGPRVKRGGRSNLRGSPRPFGSRERLPRPAARASQ